MYACGWSRPDGTIQSIPLPVGHGTTCPCDCSTSIIVYTHDMALVTIVHGVPYLSHADYEVSANLCRIEHPITQYAYMYHKQETSSNNYNYIIVQMPFTPYSWEYWTAGSQGEGRRRGSVQFLSMELVAGSRRLFLQCQNPEGAV